MTSDHTIRVTEPTALTIVAAPDGSPLLTIHNDGRWEFRDDAAPTEAAAVFVREVQRLTAAPTGITTRDALAKSLHEHRLTTPVQCACGWRETDVESGPHDEHVADALIASGAVVPADTLADDEVLVDVAARAVLHRWPADEPIVEEDREQIRHAFRALANALTERGQG